ncbi:MAG: nucleotidyl transferase AbiEii/AbiGii toxin family protein [Pseudomonadota bacterium]
MELDGAGRNTESILGRSVVIFSPSEILPVAESTGFRADVIEKVLHLLNILNTLNSHPFLKGKLALKGGSALNLFVFDIPRLSVDIDLNYIDAVKREEMLADRPKIEQGVQAVFSREGFTVKRIPIEHAGGKWRLSYQSFTGQSGNLEVDLNFMFRQPLWEVQSVDSRALGDFQARNIPVLDIHELAAGKLAALFARHQARDLFDVHQLLCNTKLNQKRLRTAFVVYGALNRKDWRTISLEEVASDPEELKRTLIPVLHGNLAPDGEAISIFAQRLVNECRMQLSAVYPLSVQEKEFLDRILDKGEIEPSLITADADLQDRIMRHPMLLWKAVNVRRHFRVGG